MKKLTTIFAALALIVSTSAFAGNVTGVNVNEKVQTAFQQNFTNAANVTWQKTNDFYFAHFMQNNIDVAVAYNEDGELVGTSRTISKSELPQYVAYSLKQDYGDFAIHPTVTEINVQGKIIYSITAENKTRILKLSANEDGAIGLEKKTKKPVLVGKVF